RVVDADAAGLAVSRAECRQRAFCSRIAFGHAWGRTRRWTSGLQRSRGRSRKQPAVERPDDEIVDPAADPQQPGNRRQSVPQTGPLSSSRGLATACRHGVRMAVERMRSRHEIARLREEQKQDAIDDRERFVEGAVAWSHDGAERAKRLRDAHLQIRTYAIL